MNIVTKFFFFFFKSTKSLSKISLKVCIDFSRPGSPQSQSPPAQETAAATSSEKGGGEEQKQVKSEEGSGKTSPNPTKANPSSSNEENQPMEQSEAG